MCRNKHTGIYIRTKFETPHKRLCGVFIADGKVIASWDKLSEKGALLLNSFIVGALMLANDYPDNIKVQTLTTLKANGNTAQTLNALKSMEIENSIVKNGGNYYGT